MISIDGLIERMGFRRASASGIGVALSGGGARGFSHLGILMALEEFGMRPNVISGVSAGSIAAVLYASGLSPMDIKECFKESSNLGDYREWQIPKGGLFSLNRFAKLLESWLSVKRLEELKIPTVVCATNIESGTQTAWGKGEIVPRVVASCSIPIVFKPVKINDAHYVDGGVLHNLPAWAIRKYCDVLYGSNCSPLNRQYKYKDSLIDIALRSYHLTTKSNLAQDIRLCDYVITPGGLANHGLFDLSTLDQAIKIGYEEACRVFESALGQSK